MSEQADVVVVGAGAAGLMAAIHAGRGGGGRRIVALDGARKLGAKILVAGGGRCNVTHDHVDERAFAGSSPAAIRKVLRRLEVPHTVAFFKDLGVRLKREETGKLFPVTDRAATVLDALLRAARDAGVELRHPWRVERIERENGRFVVSGRCGRLAAARVILASGGMSLPKTGSDGHGYEMVRSLGHSLRPPFPALVPLTLPREHFLCSLSGVSAEATLEVRSASGRKLTALTGSLLCTHFGVSGPVVLDISRFFIAARREEGGTALVASFMPGETFDSIDRWLQEPGRATLGRRVAERLSERLGKALCAHAGADAAQPAAGLRREERRALVHALSELPLPVTGDRGFTHAEVTAGGVPLAELDLETLESRVCTGLHVIGEICDVDGRIGGYNFQWAWASGYVAGTAAAGS